MKITRAVSLLVPALMASSVYFSAQEIDAKTKEFVNSLVEGHIAWESKITSSGATIVAKESRRGDHVSYRLYVTGLPTDHLYTVLAWPVTQKQLSTAIEGASIGTDGVVMCAGKSENQCGDSKTPDDPIDFVLSAAPGEPSRLAIASGNLRAAVVIVPNPISNSDKGCTITALRLTPKFELAYIAGEGFPPNTEITVLSRSYGEERTGKIKSDASGKLKYALLPQVLGHETGTTTLVGSAPGGCSPKLSFEWGH